MKTRPILKDLFILILFCFLTVFLGHIELELPGKLGINSNFAEVALIISLPFINKWPLAIILPFFTYFNVASDGYFIPDTFNHVLGFTFLFILFKKIKTIKKTVPYIFTWILTITIYYFAILLPFIFTYHCIVGTIGINSFSFEYLATARGISFEWLMTTAITILFHLLYRESLIKKKAQKKILSINKELELNVDKLSRLAYMDTATGLYNGIQLEKDIEECFIENKDSENQEFAFIAFRLESNNTFNNENGIVKKANQFSKAMLHLSDILSKEFENTPELIPPSPIKNCYKINENSMIFILNITSLSSDRKKLINDNYLSEKMESILCFSNSDICFEFQGGIVNYPKDIIHIDEIVNTLMKIIHAKRSKSLGHFVAFDLEKYQQTLEEDELKKLMPTAIESGEFYTLFQPKIDLSNKCVQGFEALARWNSSFIGFISPLKFIKVAEQGQMIETLTKNQLNDVYKFINAVKNTGNNKFRISVNISPCLLTKDFLSFLINDILKNKCENQIELEITESTLATLSMPAIMLMKKLKEVGVTIAIDDFGTGYSNLYNLQCFEPEIIKIDKTFIDHVPESKKNSKLIHAILDLAKDLNMKVVAEGIECIEQKRFLEENGCSIIQGYYYSKPLEFNSALEFSTLSFS